MKLLNKGIEKKIGFLGYQADIGVCHIELLPYY